MLTTKMSKVKDKDGVIFEVSLNGSGNIVVASKGIYYEYHPARYQEELEVGHFTEII